MTGLIKLALKAAVLFVVLIVAVGIFASRKGPAPAPVADAVPTPAVEAPKAPEPTPSVAATISPEAADATAFDPESAKRARKELNSIALARALRDIKAITDRAVDKKYPPPVATVDLPLKSKYRAGLAKIDRESILKLAGVTEGAADNAERAHPRPGGPDAPPDDKLEDVSARYLRDIGGRAESRFSVGSKVVFEYPGVKGEVPVANDHAGWSHMMDSMKVDNMKEFARLLVDGFTTAVAEGTEAVVTEIEEGAVAVKVMGGPRAGRVVWVSQEWLKAR